ncbi:MAG TPA: M15 family metallopeptidase [Micromonosporaceae bacterium]|nr:M15 family metallopeptidase [Micromonosporaceae bacterium]
MPQHRRPHPAPGGRRLSSAFLRRSAASPDAPVREPGRAGRYLRRRVGVALGALLVLAVAAGCPSAKPVPLPTGASSGPTSPSGPPPPEPSIASTPPTAAPGAPTLPAFHSDVSRVKVSDVAYTWRKGCPVGPDRLRLLHLTYYGFDGAAHTGTIIVNADVATDVVTVFRTLYRARFPIRQMVPEDAFGGKDPASMAADNTSGFNCRYAVAPGTPSWSVHAYGEAIDVNTVENPYLEGGTVMPLRGAAFVQRSPYRPGMAVPGGVLVRAFASVGWTWGGRWADTPDYQHFSKDGG